MQSRLSIALTACSRLLEVCISYSSSCKPMKPFYRSEDVILACSHDPRHRWVWKAAVAQMCPCTRLHASFDQTSCDLGSSLRILGQCLGPLRALWRASAGHKGAVSRILQSRSSLSGRLKVDADAGKRDTQSYHPCGHVRCKGMMSWAGQSLAIYHSPSRIRHIECSQ